MHSGLILRLPLLILLRGRKVDEQKEPRNVYIEQRGTGGEILNRFGGLSSHPESRHLERKTEKEVQ